MEVAVKHGLTGDAAYVHTNVETSYRRFSGPQFFARPAQ